MKEFYVCSTSTSTSLHECKILRLMQKLACLLTLRASRVFSVRTPLREFRTRAPWRDYWSKLMFSFWSSLLPIGRNFIFILCSLSFTSFSVRLSLSLFFTHFFFSFCVSDFNIDSFYRSPRFYSRRSQRPVNSLSCYHRACRYNSRELKQPRRLR